MGVIADQLRANLRELAQADARLFREMDQVLKDNGSLIKGRPAFPAPTTDEQIAAAIQLLEGHGYTVTKQGA